MSDEIKCLEIGNYRGDLHIKKVNDRYLWAVECDLHDDEDWLWEEIPESLYIELLNKFKANKNAST